MRVAYDFTNDTVDGLMQYVNKTLLELEDPNSEAVLMNGYNLLRNAGTKKLFQDFKKKSLLATWSPCDFMEEQSLDDMLKEYAYFDDVYCVCPFTCRYMNGFYGNEKFKYIPFPFTNYSVADPFGVEKPVDICYFGGLHTREHRSAVREFKGLNYLFLSKMPPEDCEGMQTHHDLPTEDKLKKVSQCKLSLNINRFDINDRLKSVLYKKKAWESNEAFQHLPDYGIPQFKVRVHESISSGAIVLCHRDPWNLIEDFYEQDEYISFTDTKEIPGIVEEVNKNYEKYKPMAEKAYKKSLNYTVEKMFEYMRTNDPALITWRMR